MSKTNRRIKALYKIIREAQDEIDRIQEECEHGRLLRLYGGKYEFTAVTVECADCEKMLIGMQGACALEYVRGELKERYPDVVVVEVKE